MSSQEKKEQGPKGPVVFVQAGALNATQVDRSMGPATRFVNILTLLAVWGLIEVQF